jgi:hypothetical protein
MNSTLSLLKQKRDSAEMEARNVRSRLACLDEMEIPDSARLVLYSVERMFTEHAAILDEAIKNMQPK